VDAAPAPALDFRGVDLIRGEGLVLHGVDWKVGPGERWAVLGPNGAGKTSLLQLASGYLHPTRGTLHVLGRQLGHVDVRLLRQRIGMVSAAVTRMLVPGVAAVDVVLAGRYAHLEPWWREYSDDDRRRAEGLLAGAGFGHIARRPFGVLSEGERQQVLLARSLMADPDLILMDEPAAGLDVGGRERLVARLAHLARDPGAPPLVLVTHHVEEIPSHFSHLALVRDGRMVVAGPLEAALTSESLSACFGLALELTGHAGRWSCRATGLG
jgi:iron complex transport system ATP-binding protein